MGMFSPEMESLIEATLQDGILTEQEKNVLIKRAQNEGIDIDELDVYIQSILQKRHQAEAAEDAENDRRSKMGSLKKCPNCGHPIQSGAVVCPACNYAFNVTGHQNTVAVELQKELREISNSYKDDIKKLSNSGVVGQIMGNDAKLWKLQMQCAQEKYNAIVNVVIGDSRGELLDLLAFVRPKADRNGSKKGYNSLGNMFKGEDLGHAYWVVFENCITAASVSFRNDPSFAQYFAFYEKDQPKKSFFAKLFGK